MAYSMRGTVKLLVASLCIPLCAGVAHSQTKDEALRDFDFVLEVVRRDYAGYPTKVTGAQETAFDALVRAKRLQLAQAPTNEMAIIGDVLAFFHDRHTAIYPQTPAAPAAAPKTDDARLAAQGPFIDIRAARGKHPLAGTRWASADGNYQASIIADPSDPQRALGVVATTKSPTWSPGQVKFTLTSSGKGWNGTYYMRDHSREITPVTVLAGGAVLRFDAPMISWVRTQPSTSIPVENVIPSPDFSLKRLSDKTVILRLPDFEIKNKETIEKLLTDNSELLSKTPNLVIDLRDNGGGSDGSYDNLMAWLYTRPIYTIGVQFRASPRNADLYAEMMKIPEFPPETQATLRRIVTGMRDGRQPWVEADDKPFAITTYPQIKANPKRVGILITGAGSSGDQFVLDARQSRKVTTFGGPTAGVIDYSNVLQAVLPSGRYRVQWATSRSMRLPEEQIDNVGTQPDIPIGSEIDDPVSFVQSWLERQVD